MTAEPVAAAEPAAGSGLFVSLEGGEGTGKSTQLNELARRAREAGGEVVTAREPGGTALGEALRGALFADREPKPGERAELLIFGAARAQPARLENDIVSQAALLCGAGATIQGFSAWAVAACRERRPCRRGLPRAQSSRR